MKDNRVYIDNSRFMEFVDEIATQMTELEFGEHYANTGFSNLDERCYTLTEEAQNFYNQTYGEVETMANNIMNLYSDNDKPTNK